MCRVFSDRSQIVEVESKIFAKDHAFPDEWVVLIAPMERGIPIQGHCPRDLRGALILKLQHWGSVAD